MANACENFRDRALVTVLYESGARIGELLTMRIGGVRPDPHGAVLTVSGKTGGRRILIVESAPTLFAWLSVHPTGADPDAPLWTNVGWPRHGAPMDHGSVCGVLRRVARKAGIKKRVHAHLFRHSRASFLANRMTEAQMNAYFGWIQGSDMPRTYVHLSGRDVDDAILAMHGLRRSDAQTERVTTGPACPKCRAVVLPNAVSCPQCWQPLVAQVVPAADRAAAPEWGPVEQLMERLLQNPKFLDLLAEEKAKAERERRPPGAVWPKPGGANQAA